MMNAKQMGNAWKTVLEVYKANGNNPKADIEKITEILGYDDTMEIFAIVAKFKEYDGRITLWNRKKLAGVAYDETEFEKAKNGCGDLLWSLDEIHTAHINNMMDYLEVKGNEK